MRVALITHKTVAAVAASVVITAGVIEYLRNQKRK
jgi:ADP-ribosylglycohydrolase